MEYNFVVDYLCLRYQRKKKHDEDGFAFSVPICPHPRGPSAAAPPPLSIFTLLVVIDNCLAFPSGFIVGCF